MTGERVDRFLSHNGKGKPLVDSIAFKLKEWQSSPRLDIGELTPRECWHA